MATTNSVIANAGVRNQMIEKLGMEGFTQTGKWVYSILLTDVNGVERIGQVKFSVCTPNVGVSAREHFELEKTAWEEKNKNLT